MVCVTFRRVCTGVALAMLAVAAPALAAGQGWIQGSWVNLRESPAANAPVRARLPTNTKVEIAGRQDSWCAVKAPGGIEGFLACNLVATAPLSLAEAVGHAGREFWVAPSVGRFIRYGALLRTGPAYQKMYARLQEGEVAKIQPLPEFDAARRQMQAGIVPKVDTGTARGQPVESGQMRYAAALMPKPVIPSLFRAQGDVLLTPEGDVDSLAAVTGTRVLMKVVAPPTGFVARHEGPEISGITGFGDIGEAELTFDPPLTVFSILPNGLVAGRRVSKERYIGQPDDSGCGRQYTSGRTFGAPLEDNSDKWPATPLKDYAEPPTGTEPLASFVTARSFQARKVKITSRLARVTRIIDPTRSGDDGSQPKLPGPAKVLLHEIDLDGDGVADILLWEEPFIGQMSGSYNVARSWYVNIDGRWFDAGGMYDEECT